MDNYLLLHLETGLNCKKIKKYKNDQEKKMEMYESENNEETRLKKPTTIEELKEWYRLKNLPPENVTRFFI